MRCPGLEELPPPPSEREGWPWTEASARLPDTGPDGRRWPRITVVTPSFNQGAYLEETIRSVLLQGYPDIEYIVADGGSIDGSVDTIRKYEPWLAHWISEPDRGQVDAINKGLGRATGLLFNWINSDDLLARGILGTVARAFDGADAVAGGCVWFGDGFDRRSVESRNLTARELILQRPGRSSWTQPSTWLDREKLEDVGGLDPRFHFVFDRDMLMRYLHRYPRVGYVSDVLAYYRFHESSKSMTQLPEFFAERVPILEKLAGLEQMGPLRRLCRRTIRRCHWTGQVDRIAKDFSVPGWLRAWRVFSGMWADPAARLTRHARKAIRRCLVGKYRSKRAFERAAAKARRRSLEQNMT